MISYLKGILALKKPPLLLIEVNKIGYECQAPMSTFYDLPDVGHEVFLHTHLAVREDAHTLYAFMKEQERVLFRALIKVSNVGPKLALAILSGIESEQFVRCIHDQDVTALTKVPGVGRKTAERLVIELRDRFDDWNLEPLKVELLSPQDKENKMLQEGIGALIALGFKPQEASRLISGVKTTFDSTETLIRLALQASIKGGKNDNNGSIDKRQISE